MTFIWAILLWALFLLPILVVVYLLLQQRRKKYGLRFASVAMLKDVLGNGPGFRRHIPPMVFLLGIAIMLIALARPAAVVTLPSLQGTVILTIDVSGSMRAIDMKPSRMEAAKLAAVQFVDNQPSNIRIGVVAFSDTPAIVQAPTTDHDAVLAAINRLSPQRGTAIGLGIRTSLTAIFEELGQKPATPTSTQSVPSPTQSAPATVSPGSYTSAVIVLLSDGQSNAGIKPLDMIKEASDRGVKVYTVGIGTPEGAVVNLEGFSQKVLLDETTLREIAIKTNALYFKAGNTKELLKIYETLSTQLVFKKQRTEITAAFTAAGALVLLVAGVLSLLWLNRLP
jgi:Ca-activated chloride channel family protein